MVSISKWFVGSSNRNMWGVWYAICNSDTPLRRRSIVCKRRNREPSLSYVGEDHARAQAVREQLHLGGLVGAGDSEAADGAPHLLDVVRAGVGIETRQPN
eukprot:COSAG04_NODE_11210_length_723_cov_1.080128_1_plen_99_part_10